MEINRRALYNSLRMNWVLDPTLEVEAWQVEDYRSMPIDGLFERLDDMDIRMDKVSFTAFADTFDTPEELTEALIVDEDKDEKHLDKVYLIVFELWRRLVPEKPALSILCDEIDYQIHLYDQGHREALESMSDTLADLQVVLDENSDEGADPHEAFDCINSGCANDIESFLNDFISEKIDEEDYTYASDLIEGFGSYMHDDKWFEFFRARLVSVTDPDEANAIVKKLISGKSGASDLDFNLEALSFLVIIGERETFEKLVKQTVALIESEEDFQALVSISADFYHRLDKEQIESQLQSLLKKREKVSLEQSFHLKDPQLTDFFKILGIR